MSWFLQGKANQLKPLLANGVFKNGVFKRLAAEGIVIDTNVLGSMNSEILPIEVST
jgi:hypothetical protein